jgi:hypothetical protein
MAAPLDTLPIVKRLKEGDFGEPQAQALTAVFRDRHESDSDSLRAITKDLQTCLLTCRTL